MPDDFTATSVALIGVGTVSIGSLVLLQVQAIKALFPRLEGQFAIFVVFVVAVLSTAVALDQVGVNWTERSTAFALYFGSLAVFVSAISQYALLFKISVRNLPPAPDAEVSAEAVQPRRRRRRANEGTG